MRLRCCHTAERSKRCVLALVTVSHLLQHLGLGIAILYPSMMRDLGLSLTQIGILASIYSITAGFPQLGFSLLSRYVRKRIILGVGNIISGIGFLLSGLAIALPQLLIARAVTGLGNCPQHPVGTAIIAERYDKPSRPWAIGIHSAFGFAGTVVGPLFLTLITLYLSWRYALGLLIFPTLAVGGLILWYLTKGESKSEVENSTIKSIQTDLSQVIRNRTVILVIAAQVSLASGTGHGVFSTFVPTYMIQTLGISLYESGIIYSIASIGCIIGPLFFGKYASRKGVIDMAIISITISTLLTFLLTLYSGISLILLPHLFILAFTGFSTSSLMQAHLAGMSRQSKREAAMGLFFTIGFGSNAVWFPLIGHLADITGSFSQSFYIMTFLGLVAVTLLFPLRHKVN